MKQTTQESGRSMVEMLGVLAVIGVLSVGGISGYTLAMNKYRANELLAATSKQAILLATQLNRATVGTLPLEASLSDHFTQASALNNGQFELGLKQMDPSVCAQLQSVLGKEQIFRVDEDCTTITFNQDLSPLSNNGSGGSGTGSGDGTGTEPETPIDPCADVTCPDNATCQEGECVCNEGYEGENCDFRCQGAQCWWDDNCTAENNAYCAEQNTRCQTVYAHLQTDEAACVATLPSQDQDAGPFGGVMYSFGRCVCVYTCFPADTLIRLADGTTKRADEITYDDELLVWDFDNGRFASSNPLWIKVAETAHQYNYLRFSDGSVLKTINQHRIFNKEAGKFTYPMSDETPIGTTTFNAKGEYVTLVEKKVVEEDVVFYNIITDYHMNLFADNILTSCRLNNIYPIQDMKFVKDNRALVSYDVYASLDKKWYDGLRLAEQPLDINRDNADNHGDKSVIEYVQRLIRMAQPYSNKQVA